jgi:parvulin-like peptidyl-prolyl isomerase
MTFQAAAPRARRHFPMLALLALSALVAGCSGPAPVAKVGNEAISLEQFQDAARGNQAQYQGAPDSAKNALLEDLTRRSLLVQEARRRHLIPDSTLARMRTQEAQKLAVERLLEVLVPRTAEVSDAEIQAFYKRRDVESHIQLIFTIAKRDADAAKAALTGGEDFTAVANRYNPAGMLPPGGDLSFMPPGALLEPLDQYLFDAPLNTVMGPDEIKGQGWAVSKILERRPRKQEPLEAQKPTLTNLIRQRKLRDLQQKAFVDLKEQYRVKLEDGAGQVLFQRFNNPTAPDTTSHGRVLARYDGAGGKAATYSLGEALTDLQDPTQQRPNFSSLPVIEHWIELEVIRRVSSIEAERRHLAQDPQVKRRVEERINNALLERMYGDEVASKVPPATLEEIQAAYQRRASALARLDAVKLHTLTVPDSASAATLAARVAASAAASSKPTVRELAAMLPANAKAAAKLADREVRYPTKDPMWAQLQGPFMSLEPGDVRGPMKTPAGWMFFELISKEQGAQPLDQLPVQIRHALEQEALEMKRDKRLSSFTDSLRANTKIEIYRDRLKKIPWPVPQANAAS